MNQVTLTINNVEYRSKKHAMEKLGCSFYMLQKAIESNDFEDILDKKYPELSEELTIKGVTFNNAHAAARFYGVDLDEIFKI